MAYLNIPEKDNNTPLTPTEWNYLVDKLNARRVRDLIDTEDTDPVNGDLMRHNGSGWVWWDITQDYYDKTYIDNLSLEGGGGDGSIVTALNLDYNTSNLVLHQSVGNNVEVLLELYALDAKMKYVGKWVQATYKWNDVVTDGTYLGIVTNVAGTTDRLAPAEGESKWLLPDAPTYQKTSVSGSVHSGMEIETLDRYFNITKIRVWVGNISPEYHYIAYWIDNVTGETTKKDTFTGDVLTQVGWYEMPADTILTIGSDVTIFLDVQNYSTTVDFDYSWNYIGTSNQADDPLSGNIETNTQNNIVRINHIDEGGGDRTSDLASVIVGTEIKIADKVDIERYNLYQVSGITDLVTYTEYTVVLLDTGSSGEPLQGSTQVYFKVPIPNITEYEYITDYFLADDNINGVIKLNNDATIETEDAYQIDIYATELIPSPDWAILADSSGGGGSGSSTPPADITIIDNLVTQSATDALSANMGYTLDQIKYSKDEFLGASAGAPSAFQPVETNASGKIDISFIPAGGLPTTTVNFPINVEFSMDKITKGDIHSMHGALVQLATAQPLQSGTTINVTNGISKVLIVAKAGTDFTGNVILTGDIIDRDTGVVTNGYVDTIPLYTLATDATAPDSLGHNLYNLTNAIISSKLFFGDVVISTTDVILSDVDVYQVAFEQFNDEPNLTIDTLDLGFLLNNASGEMNVHLYAVEVGNDGLTNFTAITDMKLLGADSVADKFYRVRRGNLNKQINGTTDGIVLAMNFDPVNQSYFEELSAKVWATVAQDVTIEAGLQSLSGDGVINTDWQNPVMDLSDWQKDDVEVIVLVSDYATQNEDAGAYLKAHNGCTQIVLTSETKPIGYNQIVYNDSDSDIVLSFVAGDTIEGINNPIPPKYQAHYVLSEANIWTVITPTIVPLDDYLPLVGGTLTGALFGTTGAFSGNVSGADAVNNNEFVTKAQVASLQPDTEDPIFIGKLSVDYGDDYFVKRTGDTIFGDLTSVGRFISTKDIDTQNFTSVKSGISQGKTGSYFRGVLDSSLDATCFNDLGLIWLEAQTGIDKAVPYLGLSGGGANSIERSVFLVGANQNEGAYSQINSRLQIGFHQLYPDILNPHTLAVNGTIQATATYNGSDLRLKDDIKYLDDKFCSFVFKDAPEYKRYGVIAQDIEDEYPELVKHGKGYMKSVNYVDLLILEVVELKRRLKELEDGNIR